MTETIYSARTVARSPTLPRILVVGIGPHARTFYLPALLEMEVAGSLAVVGLVDVLSQRTYLDSWLDQRGLAWSRFYIEPFSDPMPAPTTEALQQIVQACRPDGIIISTGPLAHKPYALWAMRSGLHILLDKPVTASQDAVTNASAAARIEADYAEIAQERRLFHGDRAFILCAHRRFHPGFDLAMSIVRDTAQQTGCPITNIHGYHSDGQWRLPEEILHQDHHSYRHGHGKLSHSGFHFLDTIYRFRKAGKVSGKEPDEVAVTAAFLQPAGFIDQIGRDDYRQLFGPGYDRAAPTPDEELLPAFASFGEMDVEAAFSFLRAGRTVALASVSLLHGGFSRRGWLQPGEDLYKGNGRVKHEQHRVHVGPFLGIQIHSCQSKDRHDRSGPEDEQVGGNNHFELWIFRNSAITGGKPFEKVSFKDLPAAGGYRDDRLFIDQVKRGALVEFVGRMTGRLDVGHLRSDFDDHFMPVRLMSALYASHVQRISTGQPMVTTKWIE